MNGQSQCKLDILDLPLYGDPTFPPLTLDSSKFDFYLPTIDKNHVLHGKDIEYLSDVTDSDNDNNDEDKDENNDHDNIFHDENNDNIVDNYDTGDESHVMLQPSKAVNTTNAPPFHAQPGPVWHGCEAILIRSWPHKPSEKFLQSFQ